MMDLLRSENERLRGDLNVARAELAAANARAEEAEAECLEQARLNGMGAERELKLMAERDAMERRALTFEAALDRRLAEEKKVSLLLEAVIAIRAWLPAPSKYVKNSKLHEVIEKCDEAIKKAES